MKRNTLDDSPDEPGSTLFPAGARNTRHGLGRFVGQKPGSLTVILAGMHGNEPVSCEALQRVFVQIEERSIPVAGTLVGILGNVTACEKSVRFVDSDLNRMWTDENLEFVRSVSREECSTVEGRELWSLVRIVDALLDEDSSGSPPVFIDLHTASAPSVPFAIVRNTLDQQPLFRGLPIPLLSGLQERLDGLLLQRVIALGGRALALEAGPHQGDDSVQKLEAALWMILAKAGTIDPDLIPRGTEKRVYLEGLSKGIPSVVEVFHRHEVTVRSKFSMTNPDYQTFDQVEAGEVVAHDRGRSVCAPSDCRIIMPLYQEAGEDGFFFGVDRSRLYLIFSELARRCRFEWILSLIPNVRRASDHGDAWRVDRTDRRWVREALRFFGYREQLDFAEGTIIAKRMKR